MQKASKIFAVIGLVVLVLGIFLMFRYSPADNGRVIAVFLTVGGPVLLLFSGWLFQIDRDNKLIARRNHKSECIKKINKPRDIDIRYPY
ncbi:hypothetical protein DRH13_01210 [Candidatus Woesebacteria bacterium]|nr:MAG: hypothetical protein DRH13_01210 [Candidatus Woesebacteria bacterium]